MHSSRTLSIAAVSSPHWESHRACARSTVAEHSSRNLPMAAVRSPTHASQRASMPSAAVHFWFVDTARSCICFCSCPNAFSVRCATRPALMASSLLNRMRRSLRLASARIHCPATSPSFSRSCLTALSARRAMRLATSASSSARTPKERACTSATSCATRPSSPRASRIISRRASNQASNFASRRAVEARLSASPRCAVSSAALATAVASSAWPNASSTWRVRRASNPATRDAMPSMCTSSVATPDVASACTEVRSTAKASNLASNAAIERASDRPRDRSVTSEFKRASMLEMPWDRSAARASRRPSKAAKLRSVSPRSAPNSFSSSAPMLRMRCEHSASACSAVSVASR
mmetsp:Transcript_86779/g.158460  ORF Transcript_86779/g.158460 Transcript_86779/m.158460 type:complete len:350 (-) Transcript_86779:1493-2542(-)